MAEEGVPQPAPIPFDSLPAGPELDSAIAEWVLMRVCPGTLRETVRGGWTGRPRRAIRQCDLCGMTWIAEFGVPVAHFAARPPRFSSDEAAALSVANKIVGFGFDARRDESGRRWDVRFSKSGARYEASADTLPLAICRAALKAVSG